MVKFRGLSRMVVKDEEIEKGRGRQIKSVEEDEQMEEKLG